MDLADWASQAAKAVEQVAIGLSGKGVQRQPLIKVGDKMGDSDEEAKRLAEDPAFLEERARLNRQMETLERALK